MSLILEALKKSEAERRLGHLPDLMTPASDTVSGAGRAWLPGFLLGLAMALLLVAGLAGWWWWATRDNVASEMPIAETVGAAADAPAPAVDSDRHAPRQDIAESARSPASAPRPAPSAAVTPAQVITQVPTREDPEFAGVERESMPMPAGSIPLPPPAPTPAAPRPVATAPAQTPTQIPAAPAPSTAAPAPVPAEPLEAVPLLSMLMPVQREGLPPLRLSMHVYDADPAGRFVLIDGRRYRQGDAIEGGLVVDVIRPDGALVARGSLRFLVPRP